MKNKFVICALLAAIGAVNAPQIYAAKKISTKEKTIVVDASKPQAEIAPTLFGAFFEDINYAADGGLYAELVKNRSFEFENPLQGWKVNGGVTIREDGPFENNPHYVHMETSHPAIPAMLENEGYFGIGIHAGEDYTLEFWANADYHSAITVTLVDPASHEEKQEFFSEKIDIEPNGWHRYSVHIKTGQTVEKSHLRLVVWSGSVSVDHISLFPMDTYRSHKNGLRKDIGQALEDLHPGMLRFPGGCIVEGASIDRRYQWKKTIGPVENRPTVDNRWAGAMGGRYFPDYYQSNGLGFYEYFQFAEDIGAEPVPVLSVGMACQFQNKEEDNPHAPIDSLDFLIQDALDLIEFANGPSSSEWGSVRAEMGHIDPFNMKYIAIGNENWTRGYAKRLYKFVKAIRREYPEIKIIGSVGASPSGDEFETLWEEMRNLGVDLADEHFYANEDFFMSNANRYDTYDRSYKTKVFAGEYACHTNAKKANNYKAALMEAALMTGIERNADIVGMSCYAPLLAHKDGWQWRPDLIWFDNLNVRLTSSYYVQKMFANNLGTRVLDATLEGYPAAGKYGQDQIYASASIDEEKGLYIIKVVNAYPEAQKVEISIKDMPKGYKALEASVELLCSEITTKDEVYDTAAQAPVKSVVEKGFKKSAHGAKISTILESGSVAVYTVSYSVKKKKK